MLCDNILEADGCPLDRGMERQINCFVWTADGDSTFLGPTYQSEGHSMLYKETLHATDLTVRSTKYEVRKVPFKVC